MGIYTYTQNKIHTYTYKEAETNVFTCAGMGTMGNMGMGMPGMGMPGMGGMGGRTMF
jgi:hypothetical protein